MPVRNGERPAHPAEVRAEVRAWLAERWDPQMGRRAWLEGVVDAGWAVPTWPAERHGRAYPAALAAVVTDEFRRVGAPGTAQDVHNLWAATLTTYGTDELIATFLRPLLCDAVAMCLLYSEPGAGSDLAALQTRAERDGDDFVVNGQKVWTSAAKKAEYGMLVARTNPDVPKHQGITFFWFPMRQPGVEVRPLRQITGESHFNEVFLTDARVPASHVLGPIDGGWRVLQTALAYERAVMGDVARGPRRSRTETETETETEGDGDGDGEGRGAAMAPGADVDLVDLARRWGRAEDPIARQDVTRIEALRRVNRWTGGRAKAELAPGTSASILSLGKLAMSRILHDGAAVHGGLVGAETLLDDDEHPDAAAANFLALNAYFTSIGGGTDQIQRTIIGERVLGLPREPDVDRDVAFRDVRKSI